MRSDDRTDVPISRNGELLAEHLRRCEEHEYNGGMRHAEAGDECRRAALKPLLGRHDPAGGRSASSLPIYRRSLIAAANRPLSGARPPRSAVGTSWPATSRPPVPRASGPRCGHPPHHRRCRPGQEPSRRRRAHRHADPVSGHARKSRRPGYFSPWALPAPSAAPNSAPWKSPITAKSPTGLRYGIRRFKTDQEGQGTEAAKPRSYRLNVPHLRINNLASGERPGPKLGHEGDSFVGAVSG